MLPLRDARLYLIVTPALCADVRAVVSAAIEGGVDIVQLRDKDADDGRYARDAAILLEICRERGVPFLLNDRWHLVEETGADGVHLGQEDAPIEQVRRGLGPDALLGLSTHDRAEAAAAQERGADYIGIGPMFDTDTKGLTRNPGGADLVADVIQATDLPVFPIGGISIRNLPELTAGGARRAAVSSAICSAADPRAAAAELAAMLRRA
ncbi:MAG: thiamine phosphate synthase [Planctomycetota bacterium]|jgi:thiamine-phosphate pyrophosphorylase